MKPREVQSSWLTTIQAVCSGSSGISRPVVALDRNHGCTWAAQDGAAGAVLACQSLPHPQQHAHTTSRRPAGALPGTSSVRLVSPSPCSKYIAAADEQFLYIIPTGCGTHPSPVATSSSTSSSRPVASIPAARVKRLAWHPSIGGLLAYTVVGQCRASLVQVAGPCGSPVATAAAAAAATGTDSRNSSSPSDVVSSSSSSDTATLQWQLHDGYAAAELRAGQFKQHSSAPSAICWVTTTGSDKQSATTSTLDGSSSSSSSSNVSNATICGSREGAAGGCCLAAAWAGQVVLYQWQPKGTQAVCVAMQLLALDCSNPPTQMAYSPAASALVMTFEAPLALSLSAAAGSGGCGSDTGTSSMLLRSVRPPIVTTVSTSTSMSSKVREAGSSIMRPVQLQVVSSSSNKESIISLAAPASGASLQTSVLDQLMSISLEGSNHGSCSSSSSREGSTAQVQQQQQQQEAPPKRHPPLVQEVGEADSAGALRSSVEASIATTGSSSSRQQGPSVGPRLAVLPVPSVLGAVAPSHSIHQTPGASVASTAQQQQQQQDKEQVHQFTSVLPLSQALPDLLQLQGPLVAVGSSTGPAAVQLFHMQAGSCQLQHVGTLILKPQGWRTLEGDANSSTAGAAGGGPSSRSSSSGYDTCLCQILLEVPRACQDSSGSTGTGTGSISCSSAGSDGAPRGLDAGGSWLLHAVLRPRGGAPPGGVHFALRTGPAPSNSSSICGGGTVGAPQLAAAAAAGTKVKCRSSTVELCLATFDLQPILPHTFQASVAPVEEPLSRQQQHSGGLGGAPDSTPGALAVARTVPTGAAGVQQTSNSEILQQLLHLQAQVQAGFQGIMQQLQRQEARLAALEALMQRGARSTDS